MEALEQHKGELSMQILREEATKLTLTKKEIPFWFHWFSKLDIRKLEHRRRLIVRFINAVFLYDDRIAFAFNYKDGSKTITLEEIENSHLWSGLTSHAEPKLKSPILSGFFSSERKHFGRRTVLVHLPFLLCNKHSLRKITLLIITILMPFKLGIEVDFDVEFFIFFRDNYAVHQQPEVGVADGSLLNDLLN